MMVEALQDVGLRHFYAQRTGRTCLSDLQMLGKPFYAQENVVSLNDGRYLRCWC
jgi:hypothetical protein